MVRRLIIAIATASALGISFYPTDASARRTRAAVADSVPSWDLTASCRSAALADIAKRPMTDRKAVSRASSAHVRN
jgi:hypothetical protein